MTIKTNNKYFLDFPDFDILCTSIIEFIKCNLFSGIATIVNFGVLNLGTHVLFKSYLAQPFKFWIFDYSVDQGGLGGFLSFLLSFFCAQAVNFVVQRKFVFGANNRLHAAIPIYLLTVIIVYIINLYVPTLVMERFTQLFGEVWALNLTNIINIFIQVAIIYPVLKLIVMRKKETV